MAVPRMSIGGLRTQEMSLRLKLNMSAVYKDASFPKAFTAFVFLTVAVFSLGWCRLLNGLNLHSLLGRDVED